jgi:hypothetical protein
MISTEERKKTPKLPPLQHRHPLSPVDSDGNQNTSATDKVIGYSFELTGDLTVGVQDIYNYEGTAGETITITTVAEWDTVLAIVYGDELTNENVIAENDDADGLPNLNSRITLTLPEDGIYSFVVGGYENRVGGPYTLLVESVLP